MQIHAAGECSMYVSSVWASARTSTRTVSHYTTAASRHSGYVGNASEAPEALETSQGWDSVWEGPWTF